MAKPGPRRSLLCPRCDGPVQVGAITKSTVCPGCGRTIRTEDEMVSDYQARSEYYNEARVEVGKKGIIIADEVRVRELVVRGEVRGRVRVREAVQICKAGRLHGDVRAPRLVVEDGAVLVGRVEICVPSAPAPSGDRNGAVADASRPVRAAPARVPVRSSGR